MSKRMVELAKGRTCLAPGCGREVSRGEALCRDHRRTGWGKEVEKALRQVMGGAVRAVEGETDRRTDGQSDRDERERVREEFRRRVARGEYGGLFDEPVRRILQEAGEVRVLDREVGALRLMLARLLMEDGDPERQALGVTRVALAVGRLMKIENSLVKPRDTLQEFMDQLYGDLGLTPETYGKVRPVEEVEEEVGELPTYGMRVLEGEV